MLLEHARREVDIAHAPSAVRPAGGVDGGYREIAPWIGAVVTLVAQPACVRTVGLGVVPVMACEFHEAPLAQRFTCRGGKPQARHRLFVGQPMRLAEQHQIVAQSSQPIAEQPFVQRKRDPVQGRAVATDIASGVERHARRPAHARLHVSAREQHATPCQVVHGRSLQVRVAVAGQVVRAQLTAHDEQEVADAWHAARPDRRTGSSEDWFGQDGRWA